jgi:2-methylcitrate dehydratase PrpD
MNGMVQTLERSVAEFLVSFEPNDIDDEARKVVKTLLKDQLALQIGASQLPWSKQVRTFMRNPRPGVSTLVAEGTKMAAADAAYLNAVYGHGFEYDDIAGNAHPGCCVVPTALAVGEEVGATLEQVITAIVAGYEVYVRLGRIGSPDLLNNGWQPHSVLANFGAAAVAAKLHGLDVEQSLHALAIALSHAGGTTEYTSTGGSIKRVHAGIAVRNGIESVQLARAGLTGPRDFLTGNKGFYQTFIRKSIGAEAREYFLPEKPLFIKQLWIKAYCCCGANHAYIDAMASVRKRVAEVVSIDAKIQTMTDLCVGNLNAQLYDPGNIEELQYSLTTQMALSGLGLGNGYATHMKYLRGDLSLSRESDVIQLGRRIRLEVDVDLDKKYPRDFVADVTAHYGDGTSERIFLDRAKGMPSDPFTPEEQRAKLTELTHGVIDPEQAEKLFALVDRLDPATPVTALTELLGTSIASATQPPLHSDRYVSAK